MWVCGKDGKTYADGQPCACGTVGWGDPTEYRKDGKRKYWAARGRVWDEAKDPLPEPEA